MSNNSGGINLVSPSLTMSSRHSSGESVIPALICILLPAPATFPTHRVECEELTLDIFSRRITLTPASAASIAADNPASPAPNTTTSAPLSHFWGCHSPASGALEGSLVPLPTTDFPETGPSSFPNSPETMLGMVSSFKKVYLDLSIPL